MFIAVRPIVNKENDASKRVLIFDTNDLGIQFYDRNYIDSVVETIKGKNIYKVSSL